MPLYIRHSCCVKKFPISSKINPFNTSPPPLFNTTPNHPKPINPLFYKPFRRPHKIISTIYSRPPAFPHFVAQKRPHLKSKNTPFHFFANQYNKKEITLDETMQSLNIRLITFLRISLYQ